MNKIKPHNSAKADYLNNTSQDQILQQLNEHLPVSWKKKNCFLLWSFNKKFQPWCLSRISSKVELKNSMKDDLVSFYRILRWFNLKEANSIDGVYGICLNLIACKDLVVIDLDDFDPYATDTDKVSALQHEILNLFLDPAFPVYIEVSASGHGVHIIFKHKNFERFTNKKFISKPLPGVEIFIGGKVNKLLILTGKEHPEVYGSGIEKRHRSRRSFEILQMSERRLEPLLAILPKVRETADLAEKLIPQTVFKDPPTWLWKNFITFKNNALGPLDASFSKPEKQPGYGVFELHRQKLQEIVRQNNFGSGLPKSLSEIDYNLFLGLIKLYPNLRHTEISSLAYVCLEYYKTCFPERDLKYKTKDYLLRTFYKALVSYYSTRVATIEPQEKTTDLLIKTPRGMLSQINNNRSPKNTVSIMNRENLKNFDLDVYNYLLEKVVEQSQHSNQNSYEMAKIKCSLVCTVGEIARAVLNKSDISGAYYQRVLQSIENLSKTQLSWTNSSTTGSFSLLEYIYSKRTFNLKIVITNLVAWCLLVDTQTIRNSPFQYVAHFRKILGLYQTSKHRAIYRYLITNCAVQSKSKRLAIDNNLLKFFYPKYTPRRHAAYKKSFISSLKSFSTIRGSDLTVEIVEDTILCSRSYISSGE